MRQPHQRDSDSEAQHQIDHAIHPLSTPRSAAFHASFSRQMKSKMCASQSENAG
jgi:hypothetical protein